MYTPPRDFVKRVKAIYRRLDVEYNPIMQRFLIKEHRAHGSPGVVFVIEDENGEFRWPDERDIRKLHECDHERESPEEKFQRISATVIKHREDHEKKVREDFRDATKDDRRYLMNKFAKILNLGKGNTTYKPVKIKPKGEVFDNKTV